MSKSATPNQCDVPAATFDACAEAVVAACEKASSETVVISPFVIDCTYSNVLRGAYSDERGPNFRTVRGQGIYAAMQRAGTCQPNRTSEIRAGSVLSGRHLH